jgi:hypothetical protein
LNMSELEKGVYLIKFRVNFIEVVRKIAKI